MTVPGFPPLLASIDAARPVFLIVMGISLMLIAWRFSRRSIGWAPRLLMAGALLLGFGYTILLPLYEAGKIETHGATSDAIAWQALKIFTMNFGWFTFGLGLALHTRLFGTRSPSSPRSHESAA
ncbi:MAG: hypothetical protein QM680_00585 [Luteolibacter sp.]